MYQQDQEADGFMFKVVTDGTSGPHSDIVLGTFARKIYQSRRDRDKNLPVPGLFQEPAWDILLDLFMSYVDNKNISVMSAGLAGHVPATTALRWIWVLEEAKLVVRKVDKNDKRRSFLFLTSEGLNYMRGILAAIIDRLQPKFN